MLAIVVMGLALGGFFDSGSRSSDSNPMAPQAVGTSSGQASTMQPSTTASSSESTAGSSESTAGSSEGTASSSQSTTFTGRSFSISYPAGWVVKTDQKRVPWGTDTTIVSPDDPWTLLRIDVTPHLKSSDPLAAAKPVIAQIAKQPGYQLLGLNGNTVHGTPGQEWEFLVTENGVLLHKVDEFIVTPSGNAVAILTQAPAEKYASLAKQFSSVRTTISAP